MRCNNSTLSTWQLFSNRNIRFYFSFSLNLVDNNNICIYVNISIIEIEPLLYNSLVNSFKMA